MGRHEQPFRQFAVPEDLDLALDIVDQAGPQELLDADLRAILKAFQLRNVDDFESTGKLLIVKPALRHPSEQGHLPAFIERQSSRSSPAVAAFVPAAGGLP